MVDVLTKIGAKVYRTDEFPPPRDRAFRNAWGADETSRVIVVDMLRARDIWRDKIRQARKEQFAQLDADFIRALEEGKDTKAISARKKELRDAPQDARIETATSPDELKLVQPAGLQVE